MASIINASTSSGIVQTADTSGVLQLQTANTAAVTVDASQNVGIGTTSPDSKLTVSGYTGGAYNTALNYQAQYNYLVCGTSGYTRFRNAAGTDLAQVDNAGVFSFNSGYGSMATAYGCRAWVNFNGTNGSIRASGNVTSVTRNGTGDYTINFTNAMPDANYCGVALPNDGTSGTNLVVGCENSSRTKTVSAFNVWTAYGGSGSNKTLYDVNTVNVSIFR